MSHNPPPLAQRPLDPPPAALITALPLDGAAAGSPYRIAPSLLCADLARLGEEVRELVDAGAGLLHLDVADACHAPERAVGPRLCQAIRRVTRAPLEVHLASRVAEGIVPLLARAGADVITFHPEAADDVDRTLALIRDHGCRAGLALHPATPLGVLDWTLERLDVVVVMGGTPGGEEVFLPATVRKIRQVRERVADLGRDVVVEVDGGIDAGTLTLAARAGADTFVAGAAIFGAPDHAAALVELRERLETLDRCARDAA